DRRGARERHAVAEDRIAERKRRESRERMATDVGADVNRPDFALRELDRGKDRPLWAAGAEVRRPRWNVAGSVKGASPASEGSGHSGGDGIDMDLRRPNGR